MKQRVKLAQALVHDPRLVLLDEPTNGLDPVGRDEMLGLIRRVHTDFGISVLVTSHLLGELERTCDHVVVIDGGTLLRSSSTSEFTQTTTTLAVEVTDSDTHPDGTDALRRKLLGAGVKLIGNDGVDTGGLPGAGHILLVEATGEETYDLVRDSVAGLGLGLVRMEQRRHHIAEVFRAGENTHPDPVPAVAAAASGPAPGAVPQAQSRIPAPGSVHQVPAPGAVQQKGSGPDEH